MIVTKIFVNWPRDGHIGEEGLPTKIFNKLKCRMMSRIPLEVFG